MSTIKVQNIQHTASSTNAISLASDGTCTANITNNLSNRRLTINGDMRIAQRGASNTAGGNGYYTVDRIVYYNQGIDNDVTKAQVDIAAGTTPYTLGFRKAFKLTNGNQSSGAGAADIIEFGHKIEAQDIANSGWNYTDPNSKITLSFWCKSSVAQNFNFFLVTSDGTAQSYPYETGSLSADTWTKITKIIPGNSNLQFDNNNGEGLFLNFPIFYGTNFTGSTNLNQWNTHSGSARTPDQTSTWYTTNGATFEITGIQLEVGSVATDFEHRSFGQELYLCQRYFELIKCNYYYSTGYYEGGGNPRIPLYWNVEKRATPTVTLPTVGTGSGQIQVTSSGGAYDTGNNNIQANHISTLFTRIVGSGYGGSAGTPCSLYINGTDGSVQISAEL